MTTSHIQNILYAAPREARSAGVKRLAGRGWALLLLLLLLPLTMQAQEDDMYKMEIGAGVGLVSYEGDFNGSVAKNAQPGASLVLRRVFNPYMGLKLNLLYGKLKGDSDGEKTYYPDYQQEKYSFSNTLMDLSLTYEYNFWPYGTGRDYAIRVSRSWSHIREDKRQERLHRKLPARSGSEIQVGKAGEPRTGMGNPFLPQR